MTVWELATTMLPLGTELTLVFTTKPKQKVNRPRRVVGRKYGLKEGNGLFLQCPNGEVRRTQWPRSGQVEMTGTGFAFLHKGIVYVAYDFVREELGDGFD